MNGAVETANKNLKKIIQKMVVTYKDWHEMLSYALHAYRTIIRTFTKATPYSLVYGMEAVMPLEVEIPSLRILKDAELDESEWARLRFKQLNLIDERRLAAVCHHQLYQSRIAKACNKKVKPRVFKEGDLVLKKISLASGEDQTKWAPNYEGPYVVKKALSGGALILTNMDGNDLPRPVNLDVVKKYYALCIFLYHSIKLKFGQDFFSVLPLKKLCMISSFHKDFWEIKVLIKKSNWCLFEQTSSENSSYILTPIKT
jgi:hypothetical protein